MVFSEKIKKTFQDNLELSYESSNRDGIKRALAGDFDLVIMGWNYINCLRDVLPKAKVIIVSNKYDLREEYLSARLGAKGFITKDIKTQSLKRVIDAVNSGQVWMSRAVATMVFKEYRRFLKEEQS